MTTTAPGSTAPTTWWPPPTARSTSPIRPSACPSRKRTRAARPRGALYRRAPDGKVTRETIELSRPNGLAFSPDGRTLYVSNELAAPRHPGLRGERRRPPGQSRSFFDMSKVSAAGPMKSLTG
ncbi:MAG: SMP-30/gluconolactonase/LRE family protein [Hymenobacter sp.]